MMPFFNKLGFECPEAKGDADFLQDVTIQKGQAQFRKDKSGMHDYMTVKVGQRLTSDLHICLSCQMLTHCQSYGSDGVQAVAFVFP